MAKTRQISFYRTSQLSCSLCDTTFGYTHLVSYGKKAKNLYLATFWIFHRPSSYTIFTDFHLFSPCACVTDKQRIDRSCMKLQIVVCKYIEETARVFTNKTQTVATNIKKKGIIRSYIVNISYSSTHIVRRDNKLQILKTT